MGLYYFMLNKKTTWPIQRGRCIHYLRRQSEFHFWLFFWFNLLQRVQVFKWTITSQPLKLTSLACNGAIWAILCSWSTYVLVSHTWCCHFFFFSTSKLMNMCRQCKPHISAVNGIRMCSQLKLEPHFSTLYMYSLALAVIQIHPNLLMVKASEWTTLLIKQRKPSCCRDAQSEGTASYSKGKGKQRSPKTETEQNRTEQNRLQNTRLTPTVMATFPSLLPVSLWYGITNYACACRNVWACLGFIHS